jgi:hypothetical protein
MLFRALIDEGDADVLIDEQMLADDEYARRMKEGPSQGKPTFAEVAASRDRAEGKEVRLYAAHWHSEHNKKSYAVRTIATNAMKSVKRVRSVNADLSDPCSAYGALYGIGSDQFNSSLAAFNGRFPNQRRGYGHLSVFDHLTIMTLLMNTFTLAVSIGLCEMLGDDDQFGSRTFVNMIGDLSLQLQYYAPYVSDEKMYKNGQICPCRGCEFEHKRLNKQRLIEVSEHHTAMHRKQEDKRKREADKEERKRARLEKEQWRVANSFSCSLCQHLTENEKLLGCDFNDQHWICSKCHGMRGRAKTKATNETWRCPVCVGQAQQNHQLDPMVIEHQ